MLLADLAEQSDRISVITFGKKARLAATVLIIADKDRIEFKQQLKELNFSENYSDIRAGIRLLANDPHPL
ncbi:MAG: hypothetical protein R2861_03680 [Desulfobacterales bacterium]